MSWKPFITCLFLLLLLVAPTFSQSRKTYKVMPGQIVSKTLPPDVLYKYPTFTDGLVHFRNSAVGNGKMNFNTLLGKIQFIDEKGDTLELNNEPPISFVKVASDTFYFEKVWMQLIHSEKNVQLTRSSVLYMVNRQRKGAMGVISEGSVNPVTQLSSDGRPLKELPTDEILTFAFQTDYFVGDRFGHFKPGTKKGFLSLFGTKDKQIEAYLNEHPVDFLKEDDLVRLTEYVNQLF